VSCPIAELGDTQLAARLFLPNGPLLDEFGSATRMSGLTSTRCPTTPSLERYEVGNASGYLTCTTTPDGGFVLTWSQDDQFDVLYTLTSSSSSDSAQASLYAWLERTLSSG